jgi:protein arginine kinase activator
MLCQICKKKEATITFTKIVGGQKTEIHLCKDCASTFSDKFSIFPLPQFDINDLLAGLLNAMDLYHKEEGVIPDRNYKNWY